MTARRREGGTIKRSGLGGLGADGVVVSVGRVADEMETIGAEETHLLGEIRGVSLDGSSWEKLG